MEEKHINQSVEKEKQKQLLKKFESSTKKTNFNERKEMYLKQTDRNYRDGDRN